MRVLHLNNEKTWRGGERQTLLTALEQRRQGLNASIACRPGSPLHQLAVENRLPIIALSAAAPAALFQLIRAMKSCDVLHSHTGRTHSLAALATLVERKPLVVSRRVDFVPGNSWFNRWKYQRADKIVCVSQCIQKVLGDWGVPREKLTVIYEAVPGDAFLSRAESLRILREKSGIPPGRRMVGNIAALVGHKDQAMLLRAAKLMPDHLRDVAFVIVGEGELKEQLLRLRKDLGLEASVFFTGFIPQAQCLLPGFDVFAMSSSMEGLGTIVLDAGQAGVPVVATAGGGLSEAVIDQQTGLVVPVGDARALADALVRVLSDSALAERLARAAQARIQAEFLPSRMAHKYIQVYQESCASNRETTG
jgi:glycosyltransferase involved in cell wall biosynthesis